jgi:uncharacterized membrane protein YhaH (DUF805 family)
MGGFGELFGFDGRLNRLGYLSRALIAALLVAAITLGGGMAFKFGLRPPGMTDIVTWTRRVSMLAGLVGLWSGSALSARRLRDMGFEPAHILPIYAALWVINTVLLRPLASLYPDGYDAPEDVWIGLQAMAALPLLFWPSHARA